MNRICRRAVAAAGALALTGGTALASTVPASASAVVPAFPGAENYSYGVNADSFLLHAHELALAQNEFGQHVEHVASFNLSNVVKGEAVVDTATDNGASSTIAKVNVLSSFAVLGLSARVVHSSCSNNRGTSGSTTIVGGLVGLGGFGEPIDTNPSPNEKIDLPGGVTVLLNDQSNDGDFFTVNAMVIELPGGQDVTLGTSVCENNN